MIYSPAFPLVWSSTISASIQPTKYWEEKQSSLKKKIKNSKTEVKVEKLSLFGIATVNNM
jgi:hypothetical protein